MNKYREKNRKIRVSVLKASGQPVVCINTAKNYYLEALSMFHASFLTKTNIKVVHDFIRKGRVNPTANGWSFYSYNTYIAESTALPRKWDCEIHQVYLAKGYPCPLCKYEKGKS